VNRLIWAVCSAVIVTQAILLGFGLTRASPADRLQTPISPPDEIAIPLDLEGIVPFANSVAAGWRSDSELVRANMQLDWPRDRPDANQSALPRGGWIMLAYVGGNELLTMRIDRGSGTIVEARLSDLDETTRASYANAVLDLSTATTTSATAMQAAEAAYGHEFRTECPDLRYTSWLSTSRDAVTGARAWHIEYEQRVDGDTSSISMDIDWAWGAVQDVVNDVPPCA
jgi:hypothetical protein